MKKSTLFLVLAAATLVLPVSALADPSGISMLPEPASVIRGDGTCTIGPDVAFACDDSLRPQVSFYANLLRMATGWAVPVNPQGKVQFSVDESLPAEGYTLQVRKDGVQIRAADHRGFFYGFQTLRQLMPAVAFQRTGRVDAEWEIPCVEIKDHPRFAWRGILVDVSRHFQTKDSMLQLIDAMAASKLNTLHWHLTDDQGWRVEIKAYPKLAKDSKQFYTQEEIREIVAYAGRRAVNIVPEIDVPGHSRSGVRSYPMLGCRTKNGKLATVYNPGKESTYKFLDKVLGEVAALFPASYIHLGADEVGMGAWKQDPDCQALMKAKGLKRPHDLQTYFVGRVSDIIKKHGKTAVAWDEALGGDLGEDLVIMSWRGMQPGMKALEKGHKVVFCPVSSLYFDRTNSRSDANPAGYSYNTVNLHRVYFFQAAPPFLPESSKALVLGAQGNIWGERIKSGDHMLRQAMLRGCALGDALWSSGESRDWNAFLLRLASQRKRLDVLKIPYFWEPETTAVQVATWKSSEISGKPAELKWDVSSHVKKDGLYEFTFEYLKGAGTFNVHKAVLLADGKPVAEDVHDATVCVDPRRPNQYFLLNLKSRTPGVKYELAVTLSAAKGGADGAAMLIPAPKNYSPWGLPEKNANRSNQKQPDEL